eukprot:SM000136S00186  [mRNA]  locus=s136:275137:275717:- [translate_table: standard]
MTVRLLQDMFDTVTRDMMTTSTREALEAGNGPLAKRRTMKRFHLLSTVKESVMDVPSNLKDVGEQHSS